MSKTSTDLTYTDRATAADRAALSARMTHDAMQFSSFKAETVGIEQHSVKAANLGREIGLSLQEYYLPPRAESAEVYFNEHYAGPLRMSFAMYKWLIAIARKLPEKSRCMQDVLPALQLTMFAGELIELPVRTEEQQSHEVTPYSFFFNSLREVEMGVDKRLAAANSWDAQTRSSIKQEVERHEHWLASVKRKL